MRLEGRKEKGGAEVHKANKALSHFEPRPKVGKVIRAQSTVPGARGSTHRTSARYPKSHHTG